MAQRRNARRRTKVATTPKRTLIKCVAFGCDSSVPELRWMLGHDMCLRHEHAHAHAPHPVVAGKTVLRAAS
jgi:hypothetical protein